MAPKRATRSNIAPETTNTISVTNSQLQAMIGQGVIAALATRNADRNTNVDDSHNLGTCVRRTERTAREYALTWWNTHVKTVGHDAAYGMPWKTLMMFPKESDKIEKYVGGLPDMIHGSVVASKPKTMQEAVEIATEMIDKKIRTFADCQTENKRKQDNNQQQQLENEIQNTGRAYAAGTDATSAIKLAIWPVTAGALQPPTMLTIRGALGRARSLLARSVKFRDILKGNV
ncbi:hypothetical protein Tco_1536971 [Tanacetum coccineum]